MKTRKITLKQARRFLLCYQHLYPPYRLQGKTGILQYIQRVGCIQFDPLNIVGRNPDLVLLSRVSDYTPEMLESLLYVDRKLVDGWDKMMSIYPVKDWPYFHRHREAMRRQHGQTNRPAVAVLPEVRDIINNRGPVSSIDIKLDKKVDWSWGPTRMSRAALESMYAWGELIVHHKVNTRKVYDFASNHIDQELLTAPDPFDKDQDYHDWHIFRRLGSVGLLWNHGSSAWLGMHGIKSKERAAAFDRLLEKQKIMPIDVENINRPLYIRTSDEHILEHTLTEKPSISQAAFIAPLDNLMWGRNLIETLFGFRYRWEVYVPAAKREYGYYVLPILYGDRFIGRFEPGWDKKSNTLIIKQWWWEPEVEITARMKSALKVCVDNFMRYRDTQNLQVLPEATNNADMNWIV
jgi:uncharacterized protein YcaQ